MFDPMAFTDDQVYRMELMKLDVLPPKCSLSSEVIFMDGVWQVRFRVTRPRRFGRKEKSPWSGWFRYEGEPIYLSWHAFWADEWRHATRG